jgi:tetratricopeptide (TPR) repeat protein
VIEKKIPSFDIVFEVDRLKFRENSGQLSPEQLAIAELIDGRRDVTDVVEESGMVEFDVGKAIYGLVTAGLLHRVGKTKPQVDSLSDQKVQEHRNLGIAFYRTAMYDEAMREFKRVHDLRPGDAGARFYTALILLRGGKPQEAVTVLQEIVAHGTAKVSVLHSLALALERLGRYDDATRVLQEAVKRGGDSDGQVRVSLGVLALRRGEIRAADTAFAEARPLWGKRPIPPVWFHFAALAAALAGDAPRAEALLREGVQLHPHAAVLRSNLAAVLERQGRFDQAAEAADQAVMDDPQLPQVHKVVGDLHYRAGRLDEALDAYLRALKVAPELGSDVHLKLGNIRYKRQETREAVGHWERALELEPDNPTARANLDAVRRTS